MRRKVLDLNQFEEDVHLCRVLLKPPIHGTIWSWGRSYDLVGSDQIGSLVGWFWSVRPTDGRSDDNLVVFGFQIVRSDRIRPDLTVSGVVLRPAVSFGPDTVESTRIFASRTSNTDRIYWMRREIRVRRKDKRKGEKEMEKRGLERIGSGTGKS